MLSYTLEDLIIKLGEKTPLSNDLIDEYLEVIERRSNFMNELKDAWNSARPSSTPFIAPSISVVPSCLSIIIMQQYNGNDNKRRRAHPGYSSYAHHADYILLPALIPSRKHWALVVVDVPLKLIVWHDWTDTMEINDDGFIQIVVREWLHSKINTSTPAAAGVSSCESNLEIATWPIVKAIEGRSAIDCGPGECGVMTLLTATYITEGRPLTQVTADHARWFRLTIAATLFNGFKAVPL